jgi:hypothetical protein
VKVSYEPKKIHTEAIQATIENIGKLSLEFEEELFYDPHGNPYFCFTAARGLDDLATEPAELYVRLGNWILPLRDELHVFSDTIFQHTFTMADDFAPSGRGLEFLPQQAGSAFQQIPHPIEKFQQDSGEISGPSGTHVMPRISEQ